MDAYVLKGPGEYRADKIAKPAPKQGEVLVAVKAAGICGSDIPRIYRSGSYFYPLVPGHEFSGIVAETGCGVDDCWIGRRVGVFPLVPCGECGPCHEKHYEMCRKYSYLGSRQDGGFAEYVTVPEWNLITLPECVTYEQAAMLEPMAVAVHAMRRFELAEGMRIAVCGLGTIGLCLLMFLKERGMQDVLAIGNKDIQKKIALESGVGKECYFDARESGVDGWLSEKSTEKGIDVFFGCTGQNEVLDLAVRHTAPGGEVVLVGNPVSDMVLGRQAYWKILRNQLTLKGTWNSSYMHDGADDWHYILERLGQGRIRPELLISHRFGFNNLIKGFEMMRDKTEEYVKVMGII